MLYKLACSISHSFKILDDVTPVYLLAKGTHSTCTHLPVGLGQCLVTCGPICTTGTPSLVTASGGRVGGAREAPLRGGMTPTSERSPPWEGRWSYLGMGGWVGDSMRSWFAGLLIGG